MSTPMIDAQTKAREAAEQIIDDLCPQWTIERKLAHVGKVEELVASALSTSPAAVMREAAAKLVESRIPATEGADYGCASESERAEARMLDRWLSQIARAIRALPLPSPEPVGAEGAGRYLARARVPRRR